jgi:DNA-directed RNA polymerase specialized sigma24 family protein
MELSEHLTHLIDSLEDPKLEQVVMLKMAAHTNEEIAAAMDCSVRSVERRLNMIRKRWNHVFENQTREA